MMAGDIEATNRWRFSVWHGVFVLRSASGSRRWPKRGSARRRRPGGWAAIPQRCSASCGATESRVATTRGRRRLGPVPGRAGPRLPSWPPMLSLPPQAISADLGTLGLRVCSETIYRACYDHTGRRGLAERSWAHLPRQRRRRKPRGRFEQAKRSALGEFRPLAERPAKAAGREQPGHWEGDLVIGKANRTAVATLVERASRHTLVVRLPGGYSAPATARAVTEALARQPAGMVKTLTWDTHNGGVLPSGRVWPNLGLALLVRCGGSVGSLLAAGRASTGRADVR